MPARRAVVRAVALAAAVALAGCGSSGGAKASPTTAPAHTTTTAAGLTAASQDAPTKALASYAVGLRTMTVVDHSRPTVGDPKRHIPASSSRTLPLYILYPATGTPSTGAAPVANAPIAAGRFPIVEFSHGVTASGPVYSSFFRNWAAAGYVVVAPTFPMTSGAGAWSDLGDYVNQPADVSFILSQIVALDHAAGDPFEGHLATSALAVAGHSLGAITTLGFYDSCCVDPRIKAAIEISGAELPFPKGNFDSPPKTPLLLIHGQADTTVPYRGSSKAFSTLPGPRAFLTAPKAGHITVIFGPRFMPFTVATSIAFLDLELRGDPARWNALEAQLAGTKAVSLAVAGGMPAPGHAG